MSEYLKKLLKGQTSKVTFFVGQPGQSVLTTINENHLLKSWIEHRLREYTIMQDARISQLHQNENDDNDFPDYSREVKVNSFDVLSHELKVLKVVSVPSAGDSEAEEWDRFIGIFMGIDLNNRPRRSAHVGVGVYQTTRANLYVEYQESRHSLRKTIHILAHVGQIDDLSLLTENSSLSFISSSKKHNIDIFTKLFPTLEYWANARGVTIILPVPTCYFGKYEDGRKGSVEQVLSVGNDILSKVAAGIELDNEVPVFESHRLLLLEDVQRTGFEPKNTWNSTFLPLLNVKAALKEISIIHCTSWAFTTITNRQFSTVWPFISNHSYLPHLRTRIKLGFPKFYRVFKDHLEKESIPDKDKLLSHLRSLQTQFPTILAISTIPSVGPLCIIHQALDFSTTLFRHSLIAQDKLDINSNYNGACNGARESSHRTDENQDTHVPQNYNRPENRNSHLLIKREVCIVDWKSSTFGSPMIDVASLLLKSLPPETRRTETADLLKLYWNEYEKVASLFGLTLPWTAEEIFKEYIHGLLYGCLSIIANTIPDLKHQPQKDEVDVVVQALRELISYGVV